MEELNYEIKKESSESVINAEKAESDNNSENNNENKEVFEENYKQMSPAKLIMRRFFRSKAFYSWYHSYHILILLLNFRPNDL